MYAMRGSYHSVHYNNISFLGICNGLLRYHRLYIIQLVCLGKIAAEKRAASASHRLEQQMVECALHMIPLMAQHTRFLCV